MEINYDQNHMNAREALLYTLFRRLHAFNGAIILVGGQRSSVCIPGVKVAYFALSGFTYDADNSA